MELLRDGYYSPIMELSRDQRAQLQEVIMKLERDFYGRGPSLVRVSVSDSAPHVITVLSVDSLTAADRTLTDRNLVAPVVAHHEAVHIATADDFVDEVETIVGLRPNAYMAQVDPRTGYAVRVFVFDEENNG